MAALRNNLKPGDAGFARWMFEFHYGGSPEAEACAAYTDIGRTLRETGHRVVAVQNPINVVEGARELGPGFRDWNARNEQTVLDAYLAGAGDDAVIVRTGDIWEPEDFIDPSLEHLNLAARDRLAAVIADAVLANLPSVALPAALA
jgi:hypothetical protein